MLGIDRDSSLLEKARKSFVDVQNLRFEERDIQTFDGQGKFDIASAARVLQWISEPEQALRRMRSAVKPGGFVVVLDYNHPHLRLEPPPPSEFLAFYDAFLRWREANGWDNLMADRLQVMFEAVGLQEVVISIENEIANFGDPAFREAIGIWVQVVETIGPQMRASGFLSEAEWLAAAQGIEEWAQSHARKQTLELKAARGKVP